jgi:hypothetical protein
MYATIRRYRTNADLASELVVRHIEEFAPLISETVAAHYVVDAGDGVIATISICEDEEKVRKSGIRSRLFASVARSGCSTSGASPRERPLAENPTTAQQLGYSTLAR